VQIFLPQEKYINKDFLKQILADEKKLLPMSEIKPLNIPRYDEISFKGLLKEALEDKEINK
jgi:hypothetical protein